MSSSGRPSLDMVIMIYLIYLVPVFTLAISYIDVRKVLLMTYGQSGMVEKVGSDADLHTARYGL